MVGPPIMGLPPPGMLPPPPGMLPPPGMFGPPPGMAPMQRPPMIPPPGYRIPIPGPGMGAINPRMPHPAMQRAMTQSPPAKGTKEGEELNQPNQLPNLNEEDSEDETP